MQMSLVTRNSLLKQLFNGPPKSPFFSLLRSESHLSTLRKKTGYALNLCKQALDKNNNDVTTAERWLKEQAARHGWQKAAKLEGRTTAQGLIGVYVNENSNLALALEVNCETDFVARNEVFRNLTVSLAKEVAASSHVQSFMANSGDSDLLTKIRIDQEKLEPFKTSIVEKLSQLGENLVLKRAVAFKSVSPGKLVGYAHAVGGQTNQIDNVYIGKYGTILAYTEKPQEDLDFEKEWLTERAQADLKSLELRKAREMERARREIAAAKDLGQDIDEEDVHESISELGDSNEASNVSRTALPRLLCQHIIGMKPLKLRYSRQEIEDLRKLAQIRRESGKAGDDDEDSEALLDQKFIINNVVIRKVLKQAGLSVLDFERIECGRAD